MPPTHTLRGALIAATAAAVLATTGAAAAAAAPAAAGPPAASAGHSGRQLLDLTDLAARRVLLADQVAAAKWGTDSPVDDPVRERQVLDEVARQAEQLGADPAVTVRVFRDQIEANKLVQRELYRQWAAHPDQVPTERPDLGRIRQEINHLNSELVAAIAVSAPVRAAHSCAGLLTASTVRTAHDRRLDGLHTLALGRGLTSVCTLG
ncbi:chorismate mutase [Streptomyces albus subsp. albus]|nr:chorismate mutase [Streptomyces albus subsp. albus]